MKVLWAPWRMEYVSSDDIKGECIFCPGKDRSRDEERLILFIGKRSIVLMNRFPYINGHLLIAPLRHVSTLDELLTEEKLDLITMVEKSIDILKMVMNPGGFNVGLNMGKVAGAGVEDHIHFHVVPRWEGDTNYMSIFGEVRVIPEHIKGTYQKLLPFFKKIKG
ncbi:MAG: HIT domain-containing protein [Thermodesulfobacteriota bacterium]|nr:HIT domain-containing protein [Thermodesulfobacteriota bacterium]